MPPKICVTSNRRKVESLPDESGDLSKGLGSCATVVRRAHHERDGLTGGGTGWNTIGNSVRPELRRRARISHGSGGHDCPQTVARRPHHERDGRLRISINEPFRIKHHEDSRPVERSYFPRESPDRYLTSSSRCLATCTPPIFNAPVK